MTQNVRKGDIFMVDFTDSKGVEQGGIRPAIVVQNDIGNKYSGSTIVCPLTSKTNKTNIPTHLLLTPEDGVNRDSVALCEQLRTVDKIRLQKKLGEINRNKINLINQKIMVSLGIGED